MTARQPRRSRAIRQMPWKQWINPHPSISIVSDAAVDAIHQTALHILEAIGVVVHAPEGRAIFAKAGARVDEETRRVRVGADIVEHALKSIPSRITLTPHNPARTVTLGENFMVTAAVLGPPACTDLERGRRSGTLADLSELLKLTQFFNAIHMNGWPVEPLDIEVRNRHLEAARAMLTLTDKVPYVFCQSPGRIRDVFEMCAIARGETLDEFANSPGVFSIINTNTPLQYDLPMTTGVIEMARFGQPVLITPFTLAGATTPATVASAMAMNTAEVLFGLTLAQLVRPGAPVVYGCAVKPVDMRTGAPAYGLADAARCKHIAGQLARRYRIPLRTSNFSASNIADMAAGYESQASVWSGVTAGTSLMMHAAGWLEGGLCTGYEKFVIDIEIMQMIAAWLEPVEVNEDTLAFEEIKGIGPGGHFFGTERTINTVETAFNHPLVSITQNYGSWMEAGGEDAPRRALKIWKQALREYDKPPLDPARSEALDAFVAKRIEQGGAPID
jgi:trimethylamine--corrinoid protein Co-methyltransferase